jgi:anti-anti-sigma factor
MVNKVNTIILLIYNNTAPIDCTIMALLSKSRIGSTKCQIVIDLSDLTFVPSGELSVLIKTLQRVEKCGVTISISGLQDNVRRIFEIRQLDRIFSVDSREKEHTPAFRP